MEGKSVDRGEVELGILPGGDAEVGIQRDGAATRRLWQGVMASRNREPSASRKSWAELLPLASCND